MVVSPISMNGVPQLSLLLLVYHIQRGWYLISDCLFECQVEATAINYYTYYVLIRPYFPMSIYITLLFISEAVIKFYYNMVTYN